MKGTWPRGCVHGAGKRGGAERAEPEGAPGAEGRDGVTARPAGGEAAFPTGAGSQGGSSRAYVPVSRFRKNNPKPGPNRAYLNHSVAMGDTWPPAEHPGLRGPDGAQRHGGGSVPHVCGRVAWYP